MFSATSSANDIASAIRLYTSQNEGSDDEQKVA